MVTGALSGLDREFCLDLAKADCRIIAAARRIDRLQFLCAQIYASGRPLRAVAVELDVSASGPAIEAAVQSDWDAFGRIDALINNADVRGNSEEKKRAMINEFSWEDHKFVLGQMHHQQFVVVVEPIEQIRDFRSLILHGPVSLFECLFTAGTGSTAAFVVAKLGELLSPDQLTDIVGVPTFKRTQEQAASLNIPISMRYISVEKD